jgi:hypothetical protein
MIACEVDQDVHADSDHLLILTLLEVNVPETAEAVKWRNWKAIDVEKFLTFVLSNLCMIRLPDGPNDIDNAVDHLFAIVRIYSTSQGRGLSIR